MTDSVHRLTYDGPENLKLVQFERALLESLFPSGWFRQPRPSHPAFDRWLLLSKELADQGVVHGSVGVQEKMLSLCRSLLDAYLLSALAGGDLRRRRLGDLAGYGDRIVQKSIRARVKTPEQFEDVMTELAFAGWHVNQGHDVTPSQQQSQADLTIRVQSLTLPLVVDCKHLESTTQRRPKDMIRKANAQIKANGERCYGIAAIDLSERVGVRQVSSDELPIEVTEIAETLKGSMTGTRNRSVSAAILIWDDAVIQDDPPLTFYRLRRRCHILRHEQPRELLPEGASVFRGFGVVSSILWDYPRTSPRLFYPTVQAKMLCRELSLDMQRAVQAVMERDAIYVLAEVDGGKLSLFLRTSEPGGLPILACAHERPSHSELLFAIPVPRKLIPDVRYPLKVLERVTDDFGVALRLGGEQGTLFLSRDSNVPETPMPVACAQDEPLFPFWRIGQSLIDQEVVTRTFLAFCLAVGRYRRWLDINQQ